MCNTEQFGQYPLQVNGFNDLYGCLEGAMVEKEIESLQSDHSVTSGREVNNLSDQQHSCSIASMCFSFTHTATVYLLVSAEMVQNVAASVDV